MRPSLMPRRTGSRLLWAPALLATLGGCATAPLAGPPAGPTPLALATAEDLRDAAAPALAAALEVGDSGLRARAALALGRIQEASSAPALAALSATGAAKSARLAALFALGQLGLAEGARPPAPAVAAVEAALVEADPEIAVAAIEALGKLAPAGAEAQLAEQLSAADPRRRETAALALFRLRFAPLWRKEVSEPPLWSDAAVAALERATRDPVAEVRRAAVYASSRFGEPRAVAALAARLDDSDALTRLFAARALGKSAEPSVADRLAARLADTDAQVRTEAMLALAALGKAELAPATTLADPSFALRAALARGLAGGVEPASLVALRQLADDPSLSVRAAAVEALARRLGASSLAELQASLVSPQWVQRVAAVHGAAALGLDGLPLLTAALGDADARVRTAAVEGLAPLPGSAVDEQLLAALAADDLAVRGAAVGALAERPGIPLLAALEQALAASPGVEWIEVREAIVDALAGLPGATERLAALAREDAAPSVRSRARLALAQRGEALPAAGGEPPREPSSFLAAAPAGEPIVVLETTRGRLRIRCFAADAPVHVANFLALVRAGYYDGLIWHRVVPNFVIQGGDPRGDGSGGPGYTIRDEINRRPFVRGTVGMPKAGKDTGGGQLFITHLPTPHLDGNYTVFGQVIDGLEVVDQIEVGDGIVRAYAER